jgi:predicted patatin/cPLA2 family phospholipase
MESPTQKITAPVSGAVIEIKNWITGAEAEYIDEAIMNAVEVKPDIVNKTTKFGNFNTAAIKDQDHREIEKFIVSVNDSKLEVLAEILTLPEEDYRFIQENIADRRKKKSTQE